jgi:hypothetical protein
MVRDIRGYDKHTVINRHFFRVVGMRRSGNHPVIDWLQASIPADTIHLNDVVPGRNAYRYGDIRGHVVAPLGDPQQIRDHRRRRFKPIGGLICSYEGRTVTSILAGAARENNVAHYGMSENLRTILILRDPFNLFASRIKSRFIDRDDIPKAKALYLEHARAWVESGSSSELVRINYNRWFSDYAYRLELQRQLGLPQLDFATESVPFYGFGSSFDGDSRNGRASSMNVLNRWRALHSDRDYQKLFEDGVLAKYAALIFGMKME